MAVVLAVDAGTTSVRTIAVDEAGRPGISAAREFPQYFPRPGRVEHDAAEIWTAVAATLAEVVERLDGERVAAIGITNQRETVVAWDRATGVPRARALVWQDRRTAARCEMLRDAGVEPLVRATTGLVLDPYFSATKIEWLLSDGTVEADSALAVGTVDSWLLWNLTGGRDGGVHATEPSNASRTMLFDIDALEWSPALLDQFGVPRRCLPTVMPSEGVFGTTAPSHAAGLSVPVTGIAGDQQAALFGQACFEPGMAKNTYGTGSFVLVNLGAKHGPPVDGLLTTVAWQLGSGAVAYAFEGSIFVTGSAVQWLRDGLGVIDTVAAAGPLAASVPDTAGVVFVPAFTGLGSPYWDPYARGALLGLTRGATRAHVTRAAIEAMAWHTADVVDAMRAAGVPFTELRVDGGASVMDLLCSFQADVLGVTVRRAQVAETTALGAAYLAGIGAGVWSGPDDVASRWKADAEFSPAPPPDLAARRLQWQRGVERARGWARDEG